MVTTPMCPRTNHQASTKPAIELRTEPSVYRAESQPHVCHCRPNHDTWPPRHRRPSPYWVVPQQPHSFTWCSLAPSCGSAVRPFPPFSSLSPRVGSVCLVWGRALCFRTRCSAGWLTSRHVLTPPTCREVDCVLAWLSASRGAALHYTHFTSLHLAYTSDMTVR